MKTLFLDVSAGVTGDALSAALLELFDDREEILTLLNGIGIPGLRFHAEAVRHREIVGTHMTVTRQGIEAGSDLPHRFDIHEIVEELDIPLRVKRQVWEAYDLVAESEAMELVAEITAVCLMIDLLQLDRIVATPICTGVGSIRPADAVLLEGIPNTAGENEGERSTPTGIALIRHFAQEFGGQTYMIIEKRGCGIAKTEFGSFTAVRASIGEAN